MPKRSYKGLVLNIILVILVFNVGILGYRLIKDPVDLVVLKLDKKTISHGDDLHIIIHNYGFKGVSYWGVEPIYRIYENDTIKCVKYPGELAWSRSYSVLPLIGKAKVPVYTNHLEPGDYLLKRDYKLRGYGEQYGILRFTVE